MVTNTIKNRNPTQPNEVRKHAFKRLNFFPYGGGGSMGFVGNFMFSLCSIWFYHVSTKSSIGSPSSQYVPNMFQIAPCLIPYPLPKSSPLVTYKEKPTIYLFSECPKSDHNFLWWANQGYSLPKSQNKIEHLGSPQLINTILIKYSSQ
jgi:hypothetical protein